MKCAEELSRKRDRAVRKEERRSCAVNESGLPVTTLSSRKKKKTNNGIVSERQQGRMEEKKKKKRKRRKGQKGNCYASCIIYHPWQQNYMLILLLLLWLWRTRSN